VTAIPACTIGLDGTLAVRWLGRAPGEPPSENAVLHDLQAVVGGWVEPIDLTLTPDHAPIPVEATLWCNEEGLIVGLDTNEQATRLVRHCGAVWADTGIVGDVAITGPTDADGETTGLSERALRLIVEALTEEGGGPLRVAPTLWQYAAEQVLAGIPTIVMDARS